MQNLPAPLLPLVDRSQFILYKVIPDAEKLGKLKKLPLHYQTLKTVGITDKTALTNFMTVSTLVTQLGSDYGVGFVLTAEDPYWFLDIDNCLIETPNKSSEWSQLALNLCATFEGAAIEISTSGRGLHILGSGYAPPHSCKNRDLGLEFYTEGRFVALTGTSIIGSIAMDATHLLPGLVNTYFSKNKNNVTEQDWTDYPVEEWNGPDDDVELIRRALNQKSKTAAFGSAAFFKDLWENNLNVLNKIYNNDESAMDLALASHLAFWTGNNCERMLRLIMQSALVREKWNREDYIHGTILKACRGTRNWLKDKAAQFIQDNIPNNVETSPQLVSGTTFVTIDQQRELFKGCVYICDSHKILTPSGTILKPEQFRVMYGGNTYPLDLNNERVSRDAFDAFTQSQALRAPKVDTTCFRPALDAGKIIEDEGRRLVNIYYPFFTPRRKGDPTPFLAHVYKILPDEFDRSLLLAYLASCVQNKGVKFKWAPLIQGVEGNGKSLLGVCVSYAIGHRYCHVAKASELVEKYNGWLYGHLFITIEDMYKVDSQSDVIEILKPMITRESYEIRTMYADKVMREICCNFLIDTNHKDGLRKTQNDRRFAPFFTAQQTKEDLIRDGMMGDYFPRLWQWLEHQNGFAIVSEYLHSFKIPHEIDPANKKPAPITSSTQEAIEYNRGGIEQEIMEAIEQEQQGFRGGWVSSIYLDLLLDRLKMNRRIPHNRRRLILQNMGYDWHPALTEGRTTLGVTPDNGRPKLYIKRGHADLILKQPVEVAKAYSAAQLGV